MKLIVSFCETDWFQETSNKRSVLSAKTSSIPRMEDRYAVRKDVPRNEKALLLLNGAKSIEVRNDRAIWIGIGNTRMRNINTIKNGKILLKRKEFFSSEESVKFVGGACSLPCLNFIIENLRQKINFALLIAKNGIRKILFFYVQTVIRPFISLNLIKNISHNSVKCIPRKNLSSDNYCKILSNYQNRGTPMSNVKEVRM